MEFILLSHYLLSLTDNIVNLWAFGSRHAASPKCTLQVKSLGRNTSSILLVLLIGKLNQKSGAKEATTSQSPKSREEWRRTETKIE